MNSGFSKGIFRLIVVMVVLPLWALLTGWTMAHIRRKLPAMTAAESLRAWKTLGRYYSCPVCFPIYQRSQNFSLLYHAVTLTAHWSYYLHLLTYCQRRMTSIHCSCSYLAWSDQGLTNRTCPYYNSNFQQGFYSFQQQQGSRCLLITMNFPYYVWID